MHTYKDKETGILFHYNSDLSGWIDIVRPPEAEGDGTQLSIPAEALSRFFLYAALDTEDLRDWMDRVTEWLNRHTNASPASAPVPKPVVVGTTLVAGDRVELTFKEAAGETGTVIEVGETDYKYANVRLDRDGTETGPLPLTLVRRIK